MAIIGIALLGFLVLAVIGKNGAQALLKGIGIVIGLIVVYLAVGSQIIELNKASVGPAPAAERVYDHPAPNLADINIYGEIMNDPNCRGPYPALCHRIPVHGD